MLKKIMMGEYGMSEREEVVLTNMVMVTDGTKILVQDRKNPNWPGLCFPGGHVDPRESFVASAIREVKEETGLDIGNVRLCGVKQVIRKDPDFRYLVFFFRSDTFSGELVSSEEGEVKWVERDELDPSLVAEGFMEMLEVFEDDMLSEHYMIKENGNWVRVNY